MSSINTCKTSFPKDNKILKDYVIKLTKFLLIDNIELNIEWAV